MQFTLLCALVGAPLVLTPQDIGSVTEQAKQAVNESAKELFDKLEAEATQVYDDWLADLRKKMAEAEETGEALPDSAYTPPLGEIVEKFKQAATTFKGKEDAVQFLVWLSQMGARVDEAAGKDALRTLLEDHTKSEGLEEIAGMFGYLNMYFDDETAAKMLAKVERENTSPTVRGWAAFSRLAPILEEASFDSEEFKTAKAEITRMIEGVKDRRLRGEVEAKIRLAEKFGIGMVAPDIEGVDLDGVAFKLSDYKGKILFVDFWGDW